MTVDPPEVLAEGVEVDNRMHGAGKSRLLDKGAVQRFEAKVNGALAGGGKLFHGAGKVTPDVTGLAQDGLRSVAAPERAGRKGKAVEKAVVAGGTANPHDVAGGSACKAATGVVVAGQQFL